jgi:hypothetical protein
METPICELERYAQPHQLEEMAKSVNDSYNSQLDDFGVWQIISDTAPASLTPILNNMKELYVGHEVVNGLLMKYYPSERVIKYHLAKLFMGCKRDTTLFEMAINSSRLDLGRVNGHSYAYEIKTEFDTLAKLQKQMDDYSQVMEYVYVVTTDPHITEAMPLLPPHCGLIRYELKKERFRTEEIKPATLNPFIDSHAQVKTMTSQDLSYILKKMGIKHCPSTRACRERMLFESLDSVQINEFFKQVLKSKFGKRWSYLKQVVDRIQPIDIQMFFISSSDPRWVYYKNCSSV